MASVTVDTGLLQQFAMDFSLIVIMRVVDNSVDALTDARLENSEPFAITGEVRAIQVDLSDDFIRRADAVNQRFNEVSLGYYLALIPKHIRPDQIVTLPDITRLGGKQLQVRPETVGVVEQPMKQR